MYAVRSSLSVAIASAEPQVPDTLMLLESQDGVSTGSAGRATATGFATSSARRTAIAPKRGATEEGAYDLAMSLSMLLDEPQGTFQEQFNTPPQSPTKHMFYAHTPANSSSSDIAPDTPRRVDQTPPSFSFRHSQQRENSSDNVLRDHNWHQTPRKMALPPSPTRKKFRMGYKKGCIDCETRVAGHHSHIEYDYS
jgi:hypothetical protein